MTIKGLGLKLCVVNKWQMSCSGKDMWRFGVRLFWFRLYQAFQTFIKTVVFQIEVLKWFQPYHPSLRPFYLNTFLLWQSKKIWKKKIFGKRKGIIARIFFLLCFLCPRQTLNAPRLWRKVKPFVNVIKWGC